MKQRKPASQVLDTAASLPEGPDQGGIASKAAAPRRQRWTNLSRLSVFLGGALTGAFITGVATKMVDRAYEERDSRTYTQVMAQSIGEELTVVLNALGTGPFTYLSAVDRDLVISVNMPATPAWQSLYRLERVPEFEAETAMALANAMDALNTYRALRATVVDLRIETTDFEGVFASFERARNSVMAQAMWASYALYRQYGVSFPANTLFVTRDDATGVTIASSLNSLNGSWPSQCNTWSAFGPYAFTCQGWFTLGETLMWPHRERLAAIVDRRRMEHRHRRSAAGPLADLQVNESDGPLTLARGTELIITAFSIGAGGCFLSTPDGDHNVSGFFSLPARHPWYPIDKSASILQLRCGQGDNEARDSVTIHWR